MAGPLAVACIVSYIGFHAIQGERGLLTWLQLSYQIEQTRAALVVSHAEEQQLTHRVSLLRRDNRDVPGAVAIDPLRLPGKGIYPSFPMV
jgi:cell division protein FtsB